MYLSLLFDLTRQDFLWQVDRLKICFANIHEQKFFDITRICFIITQDLWEKKGEG